MESTAMTGNTDVGKESNEYFCCRSCKMGIAWKNHVKTPITLTLQEQTSLGPIKRVGSFFITEIISRSWIPEPEPWPIRMIAHDHGEFQTTRIVHFYCGHCFFQLGWKVVAVEEGNHHYPFQIGQFVLPLENILLWDGYDLQVPQAPGFI